MLIYGVSGIFAHKKTIKQFLQLMIEQVWGGGGGGGGDVPLFLRQFFRATVFLCRLFLIHRCLCWVDFTNICIFFAVYYVYFIKKSVFWAQNFRDVQLIPNFLRYPACF